MPTRTCVTTQSKDCRFADVRCSKWGRCAATDVGSHERLSERLHAVHESRGRWFNLIAAGALPGLRENVKLKEEWVGWVDEIRVASPPGMATGQFWSILHSSWIFLRDNEWICTAIGGPYWI